MKISKARVTSSQQCPPHQRSPLLRAVPIACAGLFAFAATPATAQMYPPDVPVCLQVYMRGGGYTDCSYATMAQCQQSASGRGAQCMTNPFFVGNAPRVSRKDRRNRRND